MICVLVIFFVCLFVFGVLCWWTSEFVQIVFKFVCNIWKWRPGFCFEFLGFGLKQGLNIDWFICWLVTSSENTDTVDGRNPAPPVTWDEQNFVNNRIIYLSTGAVFLLSTIFTVFLECIKLERFRKWYMHDTALVANGAGDHTYLIYVLSRIRYVSICAIFTIYNKQYDLILSLWYWITYTVY